MTDDAKYVNADEVLAPPRQFVGRDPMEAFRQHFIKEHHDLITPALFPPRERIKRSFARLLRTWGETGVKLQYRSE